MRSGRMSLVRQLPRTSRVLSLYQFYSDKNQASHYCESALETDALLMLEFDMQVSAYTTQPFSIQYTLQGCERRYTPDILAKYLDGSFKSIEVKPLTKLQQPENIEKFSVLCELFQRELGHSLKLLSSADIYRGAQMDNLKRLYPYRQQSLHDTELRTYKLLPVQMNLGSLFASLKDSEESPYHSAMRLLAHDYFTWDKLTSLTDFTLLTKDGGAL